METQLVSINFILKKHPLTEKHQNFWPWTLKKKELKRAGSILDGLFEKTFFFKLRFLHENFVHSD